MSYSIINCNFCIQGNLKWDLVLAQMRFVHLQKWKYLCFKLKKDEILVCLQCKFVAIPTDLYTWAMQFTTHDENIAMIGQKCNKNILISPHLIENYLSGLILSWCRDRT